MMQRIFFFFIILFISYISSANVLISGRVINPQDSTVTIIILPTNLGEEKLEAHLPLSKTNTFQLNISIDQPTFADLYHNKIAFPIFIDPSNPLSLILKAESEKQGKVTFHGNGSQDNTFYLEYANYVSTKLENRTLTDLKDSNSKEFQEFVADRKAKKLKFIRDYFKEKDIAISKDLLRWVRNDVQYETADLLLKYPYLFHIANDRLKTKDLPKKYYKFLEEVRLNNEKAINQPVYQNFIQSYFYQYRIVKAKDWLALQSFDKQFEFAEKFFIGSALHYIQSIILTDALNEDPNSIEEEYRKYIISKAPHILKENIKAIYNRTTSPIKGKELSPLVFRDLNGNEISDAIFKNRVSYIYFWSRYNEQCRFEMKYARTLVRKFEEEKKVNILFVSTDTDIPNLKNYIYNKSNQLDNPSFTHLILDQEQSEEFKESYRVKDVPQFFLVDPAGRIVSEHTWPPSSGGAARVIKRLLTEVF